jgi:uncharacterized phage-like protein YoqJ
MKICFIGHSFIPCVDKIKDTVTKILEELLSDTEFITCYFGAQGGFDEICACVCKSLKQKHIKMELVYVTPYISLSEQSKIKEMQNRGLCDASIYPPIENTPPKFAILKRNIWMIESSDIIISYVSHNYGGAYSSLKSARCLNKKIINVSNLI